MRDDYRRHYGLWHDDTDQHFEQMAGGYERKLGRLLGDISGRSALEIGCGTGFCLGALRRMELDKVVGTDSDAGQVEASQSRSLQPGMCRFRSPTVIWRRTARRSTTS